MDLLAFVLGLFLSLGIGLDKYGIGLVCEFCLFVNCEKKKVVFYIRILKVWQEVIKAFRKHTLMIADTNEAD